MALTSITLNNGVTLEGRALARNGEVTMINDTIDSSSCAAPSPIATPKASARAGATSKPTVTAPATDTLTSTPAGSADRGFAILLVLLALSAAALVGSLRFAAIRSRSRD